MTIAFVLLLGLVVGSFLNVLISRSARGEKLGGRSRCESCHALLNAEELIPIISFFIQKGRCRNCGVLLSWQYPLVEAGTGILYAAAAWYLLPVEKIFSAPLSSDSFLAMGYWLLTAIGISAAIVIFVSDFLYQFIPDGAVLILFVLGLVVAFSRDSILKDTLGALLVSLFFAALWFLSHGRMMGFGDAKLTLATSLILGYPGAISAFLFSFWLGGTAGIILLLLRIKNLQDHLPFGPFILVGSALAFFFSEKFIFQSGLYEFL